MMNYENIRNEKDLYIATIGRKDYMLKLDRFYFEKGLSNETIENLRDRNIKIDWL